MSLTLGTAALIGAGISAGAGVASTAINAGAKWGSRTYMRVAKEMADYNQSLNEAMYNKYQSPSALMAQYKEAGLNPYLVYGNAQLSGPAAGQVSTNPQDYASDKGSVLGSALSEVGNSISRYQDVLSKDQALTNAKLAADDIAANTAKTQSETLYQNFKNSVQAADYQLDFKIRSEDLLQKTVNNEILNVTGMKKALADIDNKIADTENKRMDTNKKAEEIENLKEDRKLIQTNVNIGLQRIRNMQHDIIASDRTYNLDADKFRWQKSQAAAAAAWRKQVYDDKRSDVAWEHDFKDKQAERQRKRDNYYYMMSERQYRDDLIWKTKQWQDSHDPVKQFQRDIQGVLPGSLAKSVSIVNSYIP